MCQYFFGLIMYTYLAWPFTIHIYGITIPSIYARYWPKSSGLLDVSDGSGLGLRPKPARPRGFLGGPSPPEAQSSKPESPAGFFGPKIGQFWSQFWTEFW